MRKFIVPLLIGLALVSILLVGISPAAGSKGSEVKKEVAKVEGYQLTPADKRSQFISILLILTIIALAS